MRVRWIIIKIWRVIYLIKRKIWKIKRKCIRVLGNRLIKLMEIGIKFNKKMFFRFRDLGNFKVLMLRKLVKWSIKSKSIDRKFINIMLKLRNWKKMSRKVLFWRKESKLLRHRKMNSYREIMYYKPLLLLKDTDLILMFQKGSNNLKEKLTYWSMKEINQSKE